MTTWLNKQRKQTLLELSSEAGLKQYGTIAMQKWT